MDSDTKSLVERIADDRAAMKALTKALLSDGEFVRDLTEELTKAVNDNVYLLATEAKRIAT